MPMLDIIILVVILLSALIGLVRGLIKELLSLAAWVASFVVALLFASQAAEYVPLSWGNENIRTAIAFVALFVATLIVAALLQWLLAQLVRSTGLTGTDRFLGFLFGAARGVLVTIIVLIAVRDLARDADWYHAASIPPELLAFEDEVRDLLGAAREIVTPSTLDALSTANDN